MPPLAPQWNIHADEPGRQLVCIGSLAAEADMAVGADDCQAASGGAGEAVDVDHGTRRHVIEPVCVAFKQHVHAGPGEQFVQPEGAPGGRDGLVGQPVPGPGPTTRLRCSLHRQWAAIPHLRRTACAA